MDTFHVALHEPTQSSLSLLRTHLLLECHVCRRRHCAMVIKRLTFTLVQALLTTLLLLPRSMLAEHRVCTWDLGTHDPGPHGWIDFCDAYPVEEHHVSRQARGAVAHASGQLKVSVFVRTAHTHTAARRSPS